MNPILLGSWIEAAGLALQTGWSPQALTALARLDVPSDILGEMSWAIKGDAAATWASWFIDSFVDSARYEQNTSLGISHFYAELKCVLDSELPDTPIDEVHDLAASIARIGWQEIEFRREAGHRGSPSQDLREELWLENEPNPRCYLCGYEFSEAAKNRFLRRQRGAEIRQPLLVDYMRPRGIRESDLMIQVDHVRPVRAGGSTEKANLKLACGWCNRAKSDHMRLYGASLLSKTRFEHPTLGWRSIPRPLWVVRMVQLRGRCEHPKGCTISLNDGELFVSPKRKSGALNPSNCSVFCANHDPLQSSRFVGAAVLPH